MNIFSSNTPDPDHPKRAKITPEQGQAMMDLLRSEVTALYDEIETENDPAVSRWLDLIPTQMFLHMVESGGGTTHQLIAIFAAAVYGGMALERMRQAGRLQGNTK